MQIQEALNKAHSGHANVTVNGREVPMNDAIRQRLADALQKVSDGKGVTVSAPRSTGCLWAASPWATPPPDCSSCSSCATRV